MEQFRSFTRQVAEFVHTRGEDVFIGVDELDKIGSPEQAERFLNEIKGIFGVPHVYFMISVSDDALMAFERRGIPLRDAFDSSFDEIVRVGLLDYAESRRLLFRRVIGLSEPYVALCHAMSGGLARDLIRAARQVTRTGLAMTARRDDFEELRDGVGGDRYLLLVEDDTESEAGRSTPTLTDLRDTLVRDELARKSRAIVHIMSGAGHRRSGILMRALYDIGYGAGGVKTPMEIVDLMIGGGAEESPDAERLRLDFTAYAYFCATVREVFTDSLDHARIAQCADDPGWAGSFDALAAARHAFGMDTRIAWAGVTGFRLAWNLDVREFD